MNDCPAPETLPEPRATGPFQPDFFPRRTSVVGRWNFIFPPHEVAHAGCAG